MRKFRLSVVIYFAIIGISSAEGAAATSSDSEARAPDLIAQGAEGPSTPSVEPGGPHQDSSACSYDEGMLLAATFDEFEAAPNGWRSLAAKDECYEAASTALQRYRSKNWAKLQPHELHLLYWHEGQTRAMSGDSDRAVPLLLSGVGPNSIWGFSDYALATVAFLQHDRPSLEAARDRMARMPEPDAFRDFVSSSGQGATLAWPPDLDIVDGLLRCFDEPYAIAYSSKCRQDR